MKERVSKKSSPFYCIDHKLSALLMHFMMMFVRFDSSVGLFVSSFALIDHFYLKIRMMSQPKKHRKKKKHIVNVNKMLTSKCIYSETIFRQMFHRFHLRQNLLLCQDDDDDLVSTQNVITKRLFQAFFPSKKKKKKKSFFSFNWKWFACV